MAHLVLINPNTNQESTRAMLAIARSELPDGVELTGLTAPFGASLITNERELAEAESAVLALVPQLNAGPYDGVIVAAFGDPGLSALRGAIRCSVTGIAEAGMGEAAAGDRPFAVVTTVPGLEKAIETTAARYGLAHLYRGARITTEDPRIPMSNSERLTRALAAACEEAVRQFGVDALVIGGGPLATAARTLAVTVPTMLIEPVPAAVRLALSRLGRM